MENLEKPTENTENQIKPQDGITVRSDKDTATTNQTPEPKKDHFKTAKRYFKIALILGGIVLILFVALLVISGGDANEGTGKGAVWWFLLPASPLIYAVPILLILSIIQALLGVRDRKKVQKTETETIIKEVEQEKENSSHPPRMNPLK